MKKYTSKEPIFSDSINVVEVTDPVHADNINVAAMQLLQNTLALKQELGKIGDNAIANKEALVQSLVEIRSAVEQMDLVHPMMHYNEETGYLEIDETSKKPYHEMRYQDGKYQTKNDDGSWADSNITTEELLTEVQNAVRQIQKVHPMMSYDEKTGYLTIDESGKSNTGKNGGGGTYVLPIASKYQLGGVKIGDNIKVAADGTISADLDKTAEQAADIAEDNISSENNDLTEEDISDIMEKSRAENQ